MTENSDNPKKASHKIEIDLDELNFDEAIRTLETAFLLRCFTRAGFNYARAAKIAGMSRSRFHDRFTRIREGAALELTLAKR